MNLTQVEADNFIALEKEMLDQTEWKYPLMGGKLIVPIVSTDRREQFLLDVNRSTINLAKVTKQLRVQRAIILVRLDVGGGLHTNPDGAEISCPHIHLYREGFGDKWAFPLPAGFFEDISDFSAILNDFMRYCNVVRPPDIQFPLFS